MELSNGPLRTSSELKPPAAAACFTMAAPKPLAPLAHPEGVSARSLRLMNGPLSYIGRLFQAQREGLW